MSDDGPDDIKGTAMALLQRLREVVTQREDSAQWFAAWRPSVTTAGRLVVTLGKIGVRVASYATEREFGEILSEEDRAAIADDLRALADDFPDAAEAYFGLHHLDHLTDAILHDDTAKLAAGRLMSLLAKLVERMVSKLVDIALGEGDGLGPERTLRFLARFEGIAQEVLDRWVPRGLGMMTSVVTDEDE